MPGTVRNRLNPAKSRPSDSRSAIAGGNRQPAMKGGAGMAAVARAAPSAARRRQASPKALGLLCRPLRFSQRRRRAAPSPASARPTSARLVGSGTGVAPT